MLTTASVPKIVLFSAISPFLHQEGQQRNTNELQFRQVGGVLHQGLGRGSQLWNRCLWRRWWRPSVAFPAWRWLPFYWKGYFNFTWFEYKNVCICQFFTMTDSVWALQRFYETLWSLSQILTVSLTAWLQGLYLWCQSKCSQRECIT